MSFAIGGLSLLFFPRGLGYDPWSWLVWGRELSHFQLYTEGAASSVKPLPMFVDAFLALAGGAAPDLWLVVARAGVVMAVLLAYRLASRLAGPIAGCVAGAGFLTSSGLIGYLALAGMAEPIGTAFSLAACETHLARRRWATLLLLFGASLVKIEVLGFMVVYAAIWIVRPARRRKLVVVGVLGVLAVVPLAWFLPDVLSTGDLLRSASRATYQSQGGPIVAQFPILDTVQEGWGLMILPITCSFVVELVLGLVALVGRGHRIRPTMPFALLAVGWVLLEGILAQLHLATGAPRYLLPAVGLAAVVAGAFWVEAADWLAGRWAGRRPRMGGEIAVAVVLVATSFVGVINWVDRVEGGYDQNGYLATLARLFPAAIDKVGKQRTLTCGPIYTIDLQNPALAWALDLRLGQIHIGPGPVGTVFSRGPAWPPIPTPYQSRYHLIGKPIGTHTGWQELTTCWHRPA